jgi:hypothetical protein
MYRTLTALGLALGVVFSSGIAQAAPLPPDQVQWKYNWVPGQASVVSDNAPAGAITFTNELPTFATGSSDIVATNLRVASTLPASMPNVLIANGAYSLSLTLEMFENGILYTGTHVFSGQLSGSFSSESALVKNTFDAGSGSMHVFQLGSYDFTVTMNAYTPPGPPSQVQTGSISAHVEVTLRDGPPDITDVPEPGSMVLGGLALTVLGGAAWRKRRQKNAVI